MQINDDLVAAVVVLKPFNEVLRQEDWIYGKQRLQSICWGDINLQSLLEDHFNLFQNQDH